MLNLDIGKELSGGHIVHGRVGDNKSYTEKISVINEDGSPFDLTGLTITFMGNTHNFQTKVIDSDGAALNDAEKGLFQYTFPSEAFGVAGPYERAYFQFTNKNGVVATTGDFEVIVLDNADLNASEAETVISEFNKLIEELQKLQEENIADLKQQQDDYVVELSQAFAGIQTDLITLEGKINSYEASINETATEVQGTISGAVAEALDTVSQALDDFQNGNFWTKEESFNKEESSANVIDQIAGAESAILKKEILVNGNEGTASRYANDLGTQNLMGILKSSRFIYDLDSNRLKAPGLIEGQTITEVTLPAGTYVVSLRLFVKSSKSTSFVCGVDGTDNSSFGFLNIQNYTINTVYTRTLELTKETQIRYKSWGNTDNEPIEFEMKIEKEKYTKFTPAPEWVIDGIVPFNEADYTALLSTNEIVNAETYVPERGAEIVFEFPVIKALEVNRPFLFEGCTTDTEKIEKYISIMRSVLVPSASRGGGLSTATGNSSNYSRLYVKNTTNNSVRYWGTDAINSSNNLREFNTKLDTSSMKQVQKNGSYIFKITSKENENIGQSGAISDGISPAWVEVKDIRLIVEVEASANEIIKLEIAANHVENLATQEEAEAGEDNKKIMTPLRVMQSIKKFVENKFVSIAGNETIGGLKNFRDGLMVKENTVLTHKGVVTIKYSNADFPTEIASGFITFVRYGDEVQAVFNFKTRADKDFSKDQSIIWGIAADFQADTSEPQYIGITSTGGTTSIVKFTAGGSTLTAHSILLKDTWYAGTVTYLAKNKL